MPDVLWTQVAEDERAIVDAHIERIPVPVAEIALNLGLKVVKAPLQPKISGLIKPSSEAQAGYEIKVNKYEVRGTPAVHGCT